MHQERLCAWPISGDRRDHSTRRAVKPPSHDAPCHRTSRSPIRDKFELLAIRQEILARVCPAQEAAANDLETQEFSPRASQVGIRLRLGGALRWTAGLVSFVEPYAGSRRRPISIRRTPRSQLPRWDLSTNVPQKFLPARECWVVAHPAFSTFRELTSQAVSSGGDARDVIQDLTVRLQRVCVEYLQQYRAAVIAQVPISLSSLHVALRDANRGAGPFCKTNKSIKKVAKTESHNLCGEETRPPSRTMRQLFECC